MYMYLIHIIQFPWYWIVQYLQTFNIIIDFSADSIVACFQCCCSTLWQLLALSAVGAATVLLALAIVRDARELIAYPAKKSK